MIASKRYVTLWTLVASGLLGLSSCAGTDLGANLAIAVTPTTAFIVQGDGSSCLDALSDASGTVTTGPTQSVTGPRLYFTDFKLQWKSTDVLQVSDIRVTVVSQTSTVLTPFVTDLSNDEVAALLGHADGVIPTPMTIDSNSTANRAGYPVCGLNIGGLSITTSTTPTIPPDPTAGFTARVLIEVFGTGTATDGSVYPVKQSLYANATYED